MAAWWRRLCIWFLDTNCLCCGCEPEAHRHYRSGNDCGRCGAQRCPSYR